ncbi:hypothetical protein [Ralstonia sp. 1138]|uniref:hypothetical protein n=1 Tax=Ralstonia sp. 1138 TaxID=3156423 RepID=UPI003397B733
MINMGTQLIAPTGYKGLAKDVTYYFLGSRIGSPQVCLAWFWIKAKGKPDSAVMGIPRAQFEDGIRSQGIVIAPRQRKTPIWFGDELDYEDLMEIDGRRRRSKKTLAQHVDERYAAIAPLLEKQPEILSSDTPNEAINRIARRSGQNETRMRLWFLTYLAFSREPWSLCPRYFYSIELDGPTAEDTEDDSQAAQTKKVGRRPLSHKRQNGWPVDEEMAQTIADSYVRYRGDAVTLSTIYSRAMTDTFGCKVTTDDRLAKGYFHPQGKPFPSYGQYRYHVMKTFGQDQVQRALYGDVRTRNRLRPPEGRFSQAVANLLEKVEADGGYTKDHPTSPHCKSLLPRLCVVSIVDVASSCTVGIGFSLNRERSEAYRMALFSMAIPKKRFAELFGLTLHDGDWDCEGLGSSLIADNGPGKKVLATHFDEINIPFRECTPSWSPQSNATVESSHPRKIQVEGAPTYAQSDLSPVKMAVREIMRVVQDNHKRNISAKLTPDMISAGMLPSAAALWKYLSDLGRTDANPISFDRAVRLFLTPVTFRLRCDGAELLYRCFNSDALRETGILGSLANGQTIEVRGYILALCLRHAWLDIHGRIVEVDLVLPLRDHTDPLSLAELQAIAAQEAILQSEFREHQKAAETEYRQRFKENTGKDWDAGKQKKGRPNPRSKPSSKASKEAALGTAHGSAR